MLKLDKINATHKVYEDSKVFIIINYDHSDAMLHFISPNKVTNIIFSTRGKHVKSYY